MSPGLLTSLRERGVPRVAASYGVICWLVLQIADVTLDPLGLPKWIMTALIVAAVLGFPIAVALAWFYELGDAGLQRDTEAAGIARPAVHGKRRYADVVIIGVLLVAVGVLLVRQSDFGKPPPPASPAIAVMAFDNLSGDSDQDYFSEGLAAEVLDRLGRVPGLKVIASSSSFSFKGADKDLVKVAAQLGVTTLLTGSVRRDGRKLKINARLIQGSTGIQLWSGSFDRELTDIFAVQAELAAAVIDAIVPAARGDTVAVQVPTMSLDAHDHYLLGLADVRSRQPPRLLKAVAHFEQCVALDPKYAQAYAALAVALVLTADITGQMNKEALARAEQAAYKALALDANLSDAHGALGNVLRTKGSAGAEDEYKRALELNPNNAIATHDYGVFLSMTPRKAETNAMVMRALELDPRSPTVWSNVLPHILQTQGAAAYQKQLKRVIEIFSGDADGLALLGQRASGEFPLEAYQLSLEIERAGDHTSALEASLAPLIALGRYDESLARMQELRTLKGGPDLDFAPTEILAAGLKGDQRMLDRALGEPARNAARANYRYAVNAFWYAVHDRIPEAVAALAKVEEVQAKDGVQFSSIQNGLLPALVLVYRATGREGEVPAMVKRYVAELRDVDDVGITVADMRSAAIDAVLGRREPAVKSLQKAMAKVPIPDQFYPQLPWFKSLEGTTGYAQVVAELERRRSTILGQIAASEHQAR